MGPLQPPPPYGSMPQYGYAYGPAPVIVRTNGLAVASMVISITSVFLGFFFVPQILGIIFGHVALSQLNRSRGRESGSGMAVAGLVIGYLMLIFWLAIVIVAASSNDTSTNY